MENQHSPKTIYTILLGLILLIFLILAAFINKNRTTTNSQAQMNPTNSVPTTEQVMKKGSLLLQATGAAQLSVPYTIQINATSDIEDVVGYDAVLKFDPTQFDVVSAESLQPDLTIYTFKRDNGMTITGTKVLGQNSELLLQNTPLVRLTVTPKKVGSFTMALQQELDKEKTKFVNAKTNVLTPTVNSITVHVTNNAVVVSPTQ